jgi:hypothetical protein
MPNTSITMNLGDHAIELKDGGVLIASHCGSTEIPKREVVQLSAEETYHLYSALHTWYTTVEGAK